MEHDTYSSNSNEAATHSEITKKNEAESQEKVNKRREARRRKILENAKVRLEKLGGRINHYEDQNDSYFEYPDPEVEPNEINFPSYIRPTNATTTTVSAENMYDPFANDVVPQENVAFKYRLHVLVSVSVTYILILMGFVGDISYFSVFVPTGICVALDLILRPQRPVNPLVSLAISLSGISPRYIKIAWTLLSICYDLVIDLGLSIFSIVCITLIYSYMSGNEVATLQ